jgi:hypothetical protein
MSITFCSWVTTELAAKLGEETPVTEQKHINPLINN